MSSTNLYIPKSIHSNNSPELTEITSPKTRRVARSAWTPVENTYFHFLTIDLGGRKMVRKIATAGRATTNECVTEYIVQYSDDGEMWKSFTDSEGEEQVNGWGNFYLHKFVCVCLQRLQDVKLHLNVKALVAVY